MYGAVNTKRERARRLHDKRKTLCVAIPGRKAMQDLGAITQGTGVYDEQDDELIAMVMQPNEGNMAGDGCVSEVVAVVGCGRRRAGVWCERDGSNAPTNSTRQVRGPSSPVPLCPVCARVTESLLSIKWERKREIRKSDNEI